MSYYHVIAKIGTEGKHRSLFSDLTASELARLFIRPYEKGQSFFSGNDLFAPSDLKSIQIVETRLDSHTERDEINRNDREQIDEINRASQHSIFLSLGGGYEPEDIAQAGIDVTHTFIKGPPGFKSRGHSLSSTAIAWTAGIVATVIGAGIAKWFGWV